MLAPPLAPELPAGLSWIHAAEEPCDGEAEFLRSERFLEEGVARRILTGARSEGGRITVAAHEKDR
jgi:hypothetical protein